MSDYFAALAVRTLQPELVVQPRHRARWEDPPLSIVEAVTVREDRGQANLAAKTEPIDNDRLRRSRREHRADADPPEVADTTPRRRRGSSGYEDRVDSVDPRALPARTVTQAASRPLTAASPVVQRPPAGVDPQAHSVAPRVTALRATAGERAGARSRSVPEPKTPVRDRERSVSEPSIRIHIGRVEVRAITVPVTSRPVSRERKQALMSLDEYVQKRERGAS